MILSQYFFVSYLIILLILLSAFSSQTMRRNKDDKIPVYDYHTGKRGTPYTSDVASTIYKYQVVGVNGQPADLLPEPPARGDTHPDVKPYQSGIVQTKQAYWY